jgi:hypothetical protein
MATRSSAWGILLALSSLPLITANAIATTATEAKTINLPPEITTPPRVEIRQVQVNGAGYSTFWHAISSIDGETSCPYPSLSSIQTNPPDSVDSCAAGQTLTSSGTNWHCCPTAGACTVFTQCINGILFAEGTAVTW